MTRFFFRTPTVEMGDSNTKAFCSSTMHIAQC